MLTYLLGILTTKDLILRVVVGGLEVSNTTVEKVMTPDPDYVTPDTTILDCLKKMNSMTINI